MNFFEQVPPWLLRPLPTNAALDAPLLANIELLVQKLPGSLAELTRLLNELGPYREYDPAANVISAHVWLAQEQFYRAIRPEPRFELLEYAAKHMFGPGLMRILRRLARDPSVGVRSETRRALNRLKLREVALPVKRDSGWSPIGWFKGLGLDPSRGPRIKDRQQAQRIDPHPDLPVLPTVGAVREFLGIASEKQLGYFLLASDANHGPYTKFTISKRDGTPREICAPRTQLRSIQRQILDRILAKVPAHDAAHGFVKGRSVVTNALPHRGARLVVKWDLMDFFPTIYYYRIVGLFVSLGYKVGNTRFYARDDSPSVAPTLARLCCYAPDSLAWGQAVAPQGAPTSPAIANLVCRRLDARLTGLAKRNQGTYTRYADDLTFSFELPELNLGRFRWWVDQICHQEGFFVNERKFRVIRSSQRQCVTGIVVNNDELRIPREQRRRFRAMLHNCQKHGVASQARGNPKFADYLRGFVSYINMVQPDEGEELLRQVDALLISH